MLNYAYVVEAGRLARALTAAGFALPIGFLHSDKHGRNSLVWDAIEPLRRMCRWVIDETCDPMEITLPSRSTCESRPVG